MKEIWKIIPKHTSYSASNFGRIKSEDKEMLHNVHGTLYVRKGRILTQQQGKFGYLRVGLSYPNKKVVMESVHRLVALAFLANPNNKRTVNHIDGNKSNNHLSNLEWNTHKENVDHSIKLGIKAQAKGIQFINRTKFDELQIRVIKSLKDSKVRHVDIAKYFGVHRITINDILNSRSWQHVN